MPIKNSLGFTLVELMITVVIIGILATVGATLYTNTSSGARDSKRVGDLQEIQKALEQYYSENKIYPTSFADTSKSPTFPSFFQNGVIPTDPKNDTTYFYRPYWCAGVGGSTKYVVCARMEGCSGKCNRTALPTDACSQIASDGTAPTGTGYYCVSSLSN